MNAGRVLQCEADDANSHAPPQADRPDLLYVGLVSQCDPDDESELFTLDLGPALWSRQPGARRAGKEKGTTWA